MSRVCWAHRMTYNAFVSVYGGHFFFCSGCIVSNVHCVMFYDIFSGCNFFRFKTLFSQLVCMFCSMTTISNLFLW